LVVEPDVVHEEDFFDPPADAKHKPHVDEAYQPALTAAAAEQRWPAPPPPLLHTTGSEGPRGSLHGSLDSPGPPEFQMAQPTAVVAKDRTQMQPPFQVGDLIKDDVILARWQQHDHASYQARVQVFTDTQSGVVPRINVQWLHSTGQDWDWDTEPIPFDWVVQILQPASQDPNYYHSQEQPWKRSWNDDPFYGWRSQTDPQPGTQLLAIRVPQGPFSGAAGGSERWLRDPFFRWLRKDAASEQWMQDPFSEWRRRDSVTGENHLQRVQEFRRLRSLPSFRDMDVKRSAESGDYPRLHTQ